MSSTLTEEELGKIRAESNVCSSNYDFTKTKKKDTNMRAAFKNSAVWDKKEITVGFIPWENKKGEDWMKKWVVKVVSERLQPYIGLQFLFNMDEKEGQSCDIRITFDDNLGCYSLLGKESLDKNSTDYGESMNLGWLDAPGMNGSKTNGSGSFKFFGEIIKVGSGNHNNGNEIGATIIHEFGHAIGMIHEHQNPFQVPFLYNTNKKDSFNIYNVFGGPPNRWGEKQINDNITNLEDPSEYNGSSFDKDSIMKYSFSKKLLVDVNKVKTGEIIIPRERIIIPNNGIKLEGLREIHNSKELNNLSAEEYKNFVIKLLEIQSQSIAKTNHELSPIDKEWIKKNYPFTKEYKTLVKLINKEEYVEFSEENKITSDSTIITLSVSKKTTSNNKSNKEKIYEKIEKVLNIAPKIPVDKDYLKIAIVMLIILVIIYIILNI